MRRIVPVVFLAALVIGAGLMLDSHRTAPPRPNRASVRLTTPVLSIRRVADALVGHRAETQLQTAVERVTGDRALAPWTAKSCSVVQVRGRTLSSTRPDEPFIPASTLKLLTAQAAITVLGSGSRLATVVTADSAPVGGMVTGDLQVVGGGDPIIGTDAHAAKSPRQPVVRTRIEDLAQAVVAAGVKQVSGGVRADEGRYDTERVRPGWKPSYQATGQVAPLSALLVDDGQDATGKASAQPALQFAQVLTDQLRALGVQIGGPPSMGAATGTVTVATKESLAVGDLVAEMIRESDNTTAELLTKEMGRAAGGAGSTEAGIGAIRSALAAKGLKVAPLSVNDGSGLDRADRATCSLLLAALVDAGRTSPLADALPVAGVSGTLQKRFTNTPAAGRLRAKTGSLDGVSSLVGWVDPAKAGTAPPVAFAVVANGVPTNLDATRLADQLGVALAGWPDAPPADDVGPRPTVAETPTPAP